jgi:hypothetical protein
MRSWGGGSIRSVNPGDFHVVSTALLDPAGTPIPNAAVTLTFVEGPWPLRGPPPAKTVLTTSLGGVPIGGPDIPIPDTGTTNLYYRMRFTADHYDATRDTVVAINPPIMARLESPRPGSLGGRAFDGSTGAWLAGASILVQGPGGASATVATDATGRWYVPALPGGSYTVTTSATGYVAATTYGVVVDSITFVEATPLAPSSSGTGRINGVVRTTELPAGSAGVTLELRTGQGDPPGEPLATTSATPDGRYEFANVQPGTYTVRATGTAVGGFATVSASAGTAADASFRAVAPTSRPYAIRFVTVAGGAQGAALFYRGSPATGDGAELRTVVTNLLTVDWPRYFWVAVWCTEGEPSSTPECDVREMRLRLDVYLGNTRVAFRGVPNRPTGSTSVHAVGWIAVDVGQSLRLHSVLDDRPCWSCR